MSNRLRARGLSVLVAGVMAVGVSVSAFAADREPVTLRYLASQGSISPHELADALGYFKPYGISLENVGYAGGGPASLFALASGNVDIGSAATSAVINSIASGNPFLAAYPTQGINDKVQSVFYVLDDSPIHSIKDIAGKTIAVNTLGAHLDYTVREALHSVNLPQDAAKLVVVPGPQLEQTLRSHQVDIAAVGYWQATFDGKLRADGGVRAVFDDTDVLGEIAGGFAVLRRDFIVAHPDAARHFVEESARASDWSNAHPEEARKVFADILQQRGEKPELASYWTGFGLRPGAETKPHDLDFWVDVLEREGKLPKGKYKAADLLFDPATASKSN
jgi:ABC-type nitrate/sulfonate/bicarbonate transport system substrate-binding protein